MYTENDLIKELRYLTHNQIRSFIELSSRKDLEIILYHYPKEIGFILYSQMSETEIKQFEEIVPDMEPPSEYEVLESVDNLIYVLYSDEYNTSFAFKGV